MRLYLYANSKNKVGYIPDWLKVTYKEKELTLDIQGNVGYENEGLKCRCKGELIPWVLYDLIDGNETDLSELSEEGLEEMFPVNKILEILQAGTNFRIGVYPACDSEENMKLAEEDILSDCAGLLEIYDGEKEFQINFEFEAEFNG